MAVDAKNSVDRKDMVAMLTALGANGTLPVATTTTAGGVLKAATVANVTPATDGTAVGTAFNLLLTNLRAAGMIV